jgi:hypothetical protein
VESKKLEFKFEQCLLRTDIEEVEKYWSKGIPLLITGGIISDESNK